jgi:hypothetical protein
MISQGMGQNGHDMINGRDGRQVNSAPLNGQQMNGNGQQLANSNGVRNRLQDDPQSNDRHDDAPEDYYISDLYAQLNQVINVKPTDIEPLRIGI